MNRSYVDRYNHNCISFIYIQVTTLTGSARLVRELLFFFGFKLQPNYIKLNQDMWAVERGTHRKM